MGTGDLALLLFSVTIIGLHVGSFANVCIHRWPRNKSILNPLRSACPWCGHSIPWYDNLPIFSFLLLSGHCRFCRSKISFRYPFIELLLSVLWVTATFFIIRKSSTLPVPLAFFVFILATIFVMVVTSFIDLEWKIIPDALTIPLILSGLLISFVNPLLGSATPGERITQALIGMTLGAGFLWMGSYGGYLWLSKEVLGGGDIKLMAGLGTILGWKGALLCLLIAAISGGIFSVIGLWTKRIKWKQYIPFGPFLNIGGVLSLLLSIQYAPLNIPLFR
ncbi:MAG: prepilin peptidase [Elusimicrobia bacterium]|nr:prepilin peptidase [Candidatus Obscuribacterium magneticum]